MGWIMGNQSRPQVGDGGMSRKGMQEAGRKGWEGERPVGHNGTAAFINLWISGREGEDGEMDSKEGRYREMGEQRSRVDCFPNPGGQAFVILV